MPRKRKYEVKPICEKCGKEPNINKEMSIENWEVVDTICHVCGGRIVMGLYENGIKIGRYYGKGIM